MLVKCVLLWYSQPLTSIFGLVNGSIKKMRLDCCLHPLHSMIPLNITTFALLFNSVIQLKSAYYLASICSEGGYSQFQFSFLKCILKCWDSHNNKNLNGTILILRPSNWIWKGQEMSNLKWYFRSDDFNSQKINLMNPNEGGWFWLIPPKSSRLPLNTV